MITALAVVLFLLTMTGLLNGVPRVFLSCIVVFSVFFLLDIATLRYYRRVRRNDFTSALAGPAGADPRPLYGLLLAVGPSLLGLTFRASRVHIDPLGKIPGRRPAGRHSKAIPSACQPRRSRASAGRTVVLGQLRHLHARILELIDDHPDTKALVLDLEATGQMDATTVAELTQILSNSGQRASNCSSRACTTPRGSSSAASRFHRRPRPGAASGTASPRRCGPPRDISEGSLCRKARTLPNWTGWPIQADVPGVSAPRQTLPQNGSSGFRRVRPMLLPVPHPAGPA